jgi:hypothetical protein
VIGSPLPQDPTDRQIVATYNEGIRSVGTNPHRRQCWDDVANLRVTLGARAVLARWGNPAPVPVPLSERMPGPDDLHPEEGWAWFLTPHGDWACLLPPGAAPGLGAYFPHSHWLPCWAIPVPPRVDWESPQATP